MKVLTKIAVFCQLIYFRDLFLTQNYNTNNETSNNN